MIAHSIVAVSVAANVTGLRSNATGAAGAGWALTANSAGDGLAHLITIKGDAATDHSAKTAVITGTLDGAVQAETVNLPNGTATVATTKYFSTVNTDGVVPSATIGTDTMDIGWAAASVSPIYPLTATLRVFNVGFGCKVVSGSPTYEVQHTYDNDLWFTHPTVTAETTSQDGTYTSPVSAIRLAFAAAGGVTLTGYQLS